MQYPKRPSLISGSNEMGTKSMLKHMNVSEFSQQFDYVMVFKMFESPDGTRQQSAAAKNCMNAMLSAGLEIYPYLSVQKDELYVLVRASVRYAQHAELFPLITHIILSLKIFKYLFHIFY